MNRHQRSPDMKKTNIIYPLLWAAFASFMFFQCASKETRPVDEDLSRPKKDRIILFSKDRGEPSASQNRLVYYKIFINEELITQTASGLPGTEKSATLPLKPGKYWLYAERWIFSSSELQEDPGSYERANNVWQMKTHIEIVVEKGKPMVFNFGFDHKTRKFYWEPAQTDPETTGEATP